MHRIDARARSLIALVAVVALAVIVATSLRGTPPASASATSRPIGDVQTKSCPRSDPCVYGSDYDGVNPPTNADSRACKADPATKCWTPDRIAKRPALRDYYADHTRSSLPTGANLAGPPKRDDVAYYYKCHLVTQAPSPPATTCSYFSIENRWYGEDWHFTLDGYETKKLANSDSFSDYVNAVVSGGTFGAGLLGIANSGVAKAGLTGLALAAFLLSIYTTIRHRAADARDDGKRLRLTVHVAFIPVSSFWFSTDEVNGA